MGVFESPAVDADEATAVNDIELDDRLDEHAARVAVEDAGASPHAGFGAVVRSLFRALCWFMLVAAVVYLGVAGMNYALISGVQIPEELRGTKILLTYSAVQALLFAVAGIAGLVGDCHTDSQRYLRLAPLAPAALAIAAEATQMFNMGDHVLNNRFIYGANFFFGILAVLAGALAAAILYLSYKQGDQRAGGCGAMVTFETDPVVSPSPLSSAVPAVEPVEGVAEELEGTSEEFEGASESKADGDSDGAAFGDREDGDEDEEEGEGEDEEEGENEDGDEEEVERPHGAHF